MPESQLHAPGYIKVLKDTSDSDGIIDIVTWPSQALYYQTIHEKPMAFGDISRIPRSVREKNSKLRELIHKKEYMRLYCDYNIRYLIVDAVTEIAGGKMLYNDSRVKLYDLETK